MEQLLFSIDLSYLEAYFAFDVQFVCRCAVASRS